MPRESEAFFSACEQAFSRAKVVSFDVFDTLLERPFGKPTDLFEHVGADAAHLVRGAVFRAARVAAERAARKRARRAGRGEITFDEIYDELEKALGLSTEARRELALLELAAERRYLRPRPVGKALYERARARGCRVIYVSDMYLPRAFLAEVLEAQGYDTRDGVFVSSETAVTKGSGRMFDHVLERLGVAAREVVHIGDHHTADVKRPIARGLVALHLPQAFSRYAKTAAYRDVFGRPFDPRGPRESERLATRALVTHVARALYDAPDAEAPRSLFGGDAYRLGVQGFGPLLLGLAKWIVETAIARGYRKLFFLARDGKIMMEAYRVVAAAYPNAPEAAYLLCSRRAANVPSIHTAEDLAVRALPRKSPSPISEFLEGRFGLGPADVPLAVLAKHGMTLDTLVTTPDVARVRALLLDLAPWLLDVAREEREAYLAYLDTLGITRDGTSAVVDIGYRGTMQASIDALLGGGTGLGGLYLLTTYEAEAGVVANGLPIEGFLGQLVDTTRFAHALRTYIPVYETLFSGKDTSLVRFRKDASGDVVPVFMPEDVSEARRVALVTEVHRGALELCARVVTAFGKDFARLDFDRSDLLATLNAYLGVPHADDARLFEDVPFENAYCAAGFIPIVPAGGHGERMWLEGALARRHGEHAARGPLSRLLLAAYGSELGRAIRVLPKELVHRTIGKAMSTADAREAVRNPIAFTRGRIAAMRALAKKPKKGR